MNEEMIGFIVLCELMVVALFCAIGCILGYEAAEADAVKRGAGEYYLDENNHRKFRWRKP